MAASGLVPYYVLLTAAAVAAAAAATLDDDGDNNSTLHVHIGLTPGGCVLHFKVAQNYARGR